MNITRVESDIKTIDYIYHISDIHYRNLKRHDEYEEVLNKFYTNIKNDNLDNKIICISGDIAHSKLEMSPELVDKISSFLINCSNICPTIVIAGNHDANLSNRNRLDVLTPIINNIENDNLFYFKDTGLYSFKNILFSVMSVFDDIENYISFKDIPKGILHKYDKVIALYHGGLLNAKTDIGYSVSDNRITIDTFDGYDYVLAGDIHKQQVHFITKKVENENEFNSKEYEFLDKDGIKYALKKNPIFVYPGSLIQQNYGEHLKGHGYCLWNIKNEDFNFIELENEYGFYTANIVDGKLKDTLDNFPKKGRLRLQIKNTDSNIVKELVYSIKEKYPEISEIIYNRLDGQTFSSVKKQTNTIDNICNINVQNKLLTDYISDNFSVNPEDLLKILDIHKYTYDKLSIQEYNKKIYWKPKKLEFDNLFSYGEKNIINFEKCKNIVGLFGSNASGKSSAIQSLLYALFDKTDKCYKASQIMNNNKITLKSLFNFDVNGTDYYINRIGHRNKKGDVKVDVKFWKNENNEEIMLSGEQRRSTNDVVKDFVGSFDDFMLTTLSTQKNFSSFIEKGQSDRKDLLAKFLGINVFDNLYTQALEDHKNIITFLYKNNSVDIKREIENYNNDILKCVDDIKNIKEKIAENNKQQEELNSKILELNSKLITISVTEDIDVLNLQKKKHEETLLKYTQDYKLLNSEQINLQEKLDKLNNKWLSKIKDENLLKKNSELYLSLENDIKFLSLKLNEFKIKVSNKIEKLKTLDKHEYDPNCIYCMNNIFVKDAIETRKSLDVDKEEVIKIVNEIKEKTEFKNKLNEDYKLYNEYIEDTKHIQNVSQLIDNIFIKIDSLKSKGQLEKSNLNNCIEKINQYNQNIESIKNNKLINSNIEDLKKDIKNLKYKFEQLNSEHVTVKSKYNFNKTKLNELELLLVEVLEKESKNDLYRIYIDVIKRDGIQYQIIKNTLPILENEINTILHQIVDFTLKFETDEKNININIQYDNGSWPIELGSGMETFISSIALRVALTNISNLPRSNFMIIDEGFGVLDVEHMSSIYNVFNYLKTKFDFVIVISHLDWLKDLVDTHLEIKKENGFSKVEYI
jgi:DNA repair exonuclease SbcCD ATPase subunit/predicted MPP superfamily phosphohydrolase